MQLFALGQAGQFFHQARVTGCYARVLASSQLNTKIRQQRAAGSHDGQQHGGGAARDASGDGLAQYLQRCGKLVDLHDSSM